jgi:catalase
LGSRNDEAQKISGKHPDSRRDHWEAIESEAFPVWELGLQVIEADEHKYDFDLLDATKIVPRSSSPCSAWGG